MSEFDAYFDAAESAHADQAAAARLSREADLRRSQEAERIVAWVGSQVAPSARDRLRREGIKPQRGSGWGLPYADQALGSPGVFATVTRAGDLRLNTGPITWVDVGREVGKFNDSDHLPGPKVVVDKGSKEVYVLWYDGIHLSSTPFVGYVAQCVHQAILHTRERRQQR